MIWIPPQRFARYLCFDASLQPARRYRAFLRSFRLGEIRLILLVEQRLQKFHQKIRKSSSIFASAAPGTKNAKKMPVLSIIDAFDEIHRKRRRHAELQGCCGAPEVESHLHATHYLVKGAGD